MIKKVTQFRFFGDNNTKFNTDNDDIIYHHLNENQPKGLTAIQLISGEVFRKYTPIIQLGIQTLPGVKFNLNSNLDYSIIGASGIYELDLTDSSISLSSLTFEENSLELINKNPDGYLIIDIVYQED